LADIIRRDITREKLASSDDADEIVFVQGKKTLRKRVPESEFMQLARKAMDRRTVAAGLQQRVLSTLMKQHVH
jgi:hypothetical protein